VNIKILFNKRESEISYLFHHRGNLLFFPFIFQFAYYEIAIVLYELQHN